MKLIPQSWEWIKEPEEWIEVAGRTCYKSEDKITDDSSEKFMQMMKKSGHHAMIEHSVAAIRIISNRGFTHELVRHRLAAYAQESTRYCNYSKEKFGNEITVIKPPYFDTWSRASQLIWEDHMKYCEESYIAMINSNVPAQEARGVLPIDVKTEIVITANFREWMHIFKLRCAKGAHPHIRDLMREVHSEFTERVPALFEYQEYWKE